ncbi:hypothetical protein L2U69_10720 [Zavarzinia compransoris]|uniref:hypothetical protein n=1 Tax=Zavarzinia marina TaxID=2911065 RepID=UPI001F39EC2D|nr:hypothetical protein [Zavarzinia marina]MCF4166116.1 hypothetical protein [Zavarzinia marina]
MKPILRRANLRKIVAMALVVGMVSALGACGARLKGGASGGTGRGSSAGGGISIPFP